MREGRLNGWAIRDEEGGPEYRRLGGQSRDDDKDGFELTVLQRVRCHCSKSFARAEPFFQYTAS